MCVKEFFGYICGHCSIPTIRPCPLSQSSEQYPLCKYPAERPISTDAYCHPCMRVVWNAEVLKEEQKHHQRHLDKLCDCGTIFKGMEEERARLSKGNGKGKASAVDDYGRQQGACCASEEPKMGENSGSEASARDGWEEETKKVAYDYMGYRPEPSSTFSYEYGDSCAGGQKVYATSAEHLGLGRAQPEYAVAPSQSSRYVRYDAKGNTQMVNLGELLRAPYPNYGEQLGAAVLVEQPWSPVDEYSNQGMVSIADPGLPWWEATDYGGGGRVVQSGVKWYPDPSTHPAYTSIPSHSSKPDLSFSSHQHQHQYQYQHRYHNKRPRKTKSEGGFRGSGGGVQVPVENEGAGGDEHLTYPVVVSSTVVGKAASDK